MNLNRAVADSIANDDVGTGYKTDGGYSTWTSSNAWMSSSTKPGCSG